MEVELTQFSDGVKVTVLEHNNKYYYAEQTIKDTVIGYEIGEFAKKTRFGSKEHYLGISTTKKFGLRSRLDKCFRISDKNNAYNEYKNACNNG